jgi:hypothetical protein
MSEMKFHVSSGPSSQLDADAGGSFHISAGNGFRRENQAAVIKPEQSRQLPKPNPHADLAKVGLIEEATGEKAEI